MLESYPPLVGWDQNIKVSHTFVRRGTQKETYPTGEVVGNWTQTGRIPNDCSCGFILFYLYWSFLQILGGINAKRGFHSFWFMSIS